ncbi:DUF881 domain-containing protein [Occultella glacieicola]|uniref:DUF881 domain-containing protein n=1 Tax=Occultella glacieicola TaxID=2518684 RepID=A0ABY2E342_9MICO|nr:DUF881 domain-containing protein [Occultella glacieicola]TDE92566.1 DUF881 domain-containing protein [Occultella glacieicola]
MTLLNEVTERPLDPGYAAAAAARAAGTGPRHGPVSRVLVLLAAAVLGLGGVWATKALRAPAPSGESARAVLIEQIRERIATSEELTAQNDGVRAEINDLQVAALGSGNAQVLDESAALAVPAGSTAVHGPGVVVTLEDSDRAQNNEPGTQEQRVQDFDLQVVVNGLWASGAEAISINGHRLTGATAIRTAGEAILVDLQPLVTPYVVEAIGDPQDLRTEFARSSAATHLSTLSSQFSIPSSVVPADDLVLSAGTTSNLANVTESS